MFKHAFKLDDHINNIIDPSIDAQHNILQGNIGKLLLGKSDIHTTDRLQNSILGKGYDYVPSNKLITLNNSTRVNSAGLIEHVPTHFYDSSPLHFGDLGIGISWPDLKNNIPGHIYAHDGKRALNFTYNYNVSQPASAVPHDPPLKQITNNGKKTVVPMSVKELYPTLTNPINSYEN